MFLPLHITGSLWGQTSEQSNFTAGTVPAECFRKLQKCLQVRKNFCLAFIGLEEQLGKLHTLSSHICLSLFMLILYLHLKEDELEFPNLLFLHQVTAVLHTGLF